MNLWVLVWRSEGEPNVAVVPLDHNESSDDQGMLVYQSEEAAESAAKYQDENYGDEHRCVAVRLESYMSQASSC